MTVNLGSRPYFWNSVAFSRRYYYGLFDFPSSHKSHHKYCQSTECDRRNLLITFIVRCSYHTGKDGCGPVLRRNGDILVQFT